MADPSKNQFHADENAPRLHQNSFNLHLFRQAGRFADAEKIGFAHGLLLPQSPNHQLRHINPIARMRNGIAGNHLADA